MSLAGQKVVIIGGSAGIGKATARAAAAAGAEVVIASRSGEHLEEAAGEIAAAGGMAGAGEMAGRVRTCVIDVRDPRGMDYCLEEQSPFDHLVVTAADVQRVPFIELDLDEAKTLFEVKFWGQVAAVQSAAPDLRDGGSITLFSGVAAHQPLPGMSIIGAVNGAIEALMRSLALELSPLRINAISPGPVDTHGMPDARKQRLAQTLPAQRVGEAADVAEAVLFLMRNPFVTGTVLHVDGGRRFV